MNILKEKELEILEFWKKNKIYEKRKAKNKKGKKFYFLQGPPYTSGKLHIGHAWNNSMKDIILRYLRMKGMDVWDRAGYDMHGLPTSNAVMKKLGLRDKDEIIKFGVDRFIKECTDFSISNAKMMDQDLQRLGVWLDYTDPYYPVSPIFIEGEWWLIKKAYEQRRLYKGKKVMHWCAKCETSLAKHELEYEKLKEKSIFLKFPIKEKKNEFLVIWTTTPWTIPFNLAVMVNPKVRYAKVKVDKEVWIVAKDLVEEIAKVTKKKLTVTEIIEGKNLEGIKYVHPFDLELKKQFESIKSKNLHSVILSEQYVTTETGSGLVHCAPGCGPEDYEVGVKYGLCPLNNVNEKGIFEDMGEFSGFIAKKDDDKFINVLKKKGALLAIEKVEHDYATCWRCHEPVIFRTTEQWFMKIEDLIPKMISSNKKIHWVPKWGRDAFESWINVLKDNSITRQTFWGTPVPIWQCESCNAVEVIGSIKELKEKATTKVPENLHRPMIDSVLLRCNKCAGEMKRVPDVIDVWIDAGTLSWNCLYYPSRTDLFKKLFPADLVLEATEQIKLWFSMLLICSMIAFRKPCYKRVYMHGMILDYQGMKMSKSLGNIISPYEVIDKYGADILRYYMCETAAGTNINFNWENIKIKQANLNILLNIEKYVQNLADEIKENPKKFKVKLGLEEKFIISKLNSTIKKATELLENYKLDEVITLLESFYLEISRGYIQMIREKVNDEEGKKVVLYTVYKSLMEFLKMFSIICPFITELIYQDLRKKFNLKEESIHLYSWPKVDEKMIDEKLEKEMKTLQEILTVILARREEAKIGLRWPLASAEIISKEKIRKELIELLEKIANIKKINLRIGDVYDVTLNTEMTPELEAEGYGREIIRKIQVLRKNAGLKKENKIRLAIVADIEILKMLRLQEKAIKERVNAQIIEMTADEFILNGYKNKKEEKIKDREIKIGFDVL